MITVLIVDDQPLMREGLATLLNMKDGISVVGNAADGKEAFEKAKELAPDIVLMDIRMPGTNGVEGTRLIKEHLKDVKVLMLTTFSDSELIFEALEEGASGYLLKDMPADAIVQAMGAVQAGGLVLPPNITGQILQELKKTRGTETGLKEAPVPDALRDLTEREIEVLRQIGYGMSNKEIAGVLYITEGTVKNHVSNLINKLALRDRTQAAIFAVRYGITVFPET
ncbi:response regulator transcription factor [Metabacillus sp. GX 13764]|uniref:response regulator n=1 Tax=Metabacillus kandeliae TaxID=2900151 RepID=UPI001E493D4F|nr:response regulator transcription factor [Metabacillus kandeliae]MCD7033995.1 response regulator transcription factor [Metabacillus kandeliae]